MSGLSPDSLAFQKIFCPFDEEYYFDMWLSEARSRGMIKESEMRRWRLTALCLMAAMVEAGDA